MAVVRTGSGEPDIPHSAIDSCFSIRSPDSEGLTLTSHAHIVYAQGCEASIVLAGCADHHGSSISSNSGETSIASAGTHIVLTASTISSTE